MDAGAEAVTAAVLSTEVFADGVDFVFADVDAVLEDAAFVVFLTVDFAEVVFLTDAFAVLVIWAFLVQIVNQHAFVFVAISWTVYAIGA